jgi:dolichol-phosphate mannosyltransferase
VKKPKCLVIIPTYNERDNIEKIIVEILAINESFYILIVDDNSEDLTGELAEQLKSVHPRLNVLHRPEKLGLGTAYIAGFKYALKNDFQFIFEMDADFSHPPDYLMDLYSAVQTCDLAIGSRYIKGVNVVNWPMHRLLLSYTANIYARIITGIPVMDLTGGFKCFRKEVLESINLDKIMSEGYAFQIEMNFRACRKGFRIKEIPIIFHERRAGQSKISKHVILEAIWSVWKLRLLELFRLL